MKDEILSSKQNEVFITKNGVLIERQVISDKYRVDVTNVSIDQIFTVCAPGSLETSLVFGNGFSIQLTETQRQRIKSCL